MSTKQRGIEDTVASAISGPRLAPYIAATGSMAEAVRLYRWNIEMGGAIHEALGIVEVGLRNAIDRELQRWNPGRPPRPGLPAHGTNWVEHPAGPLHRILNPSGRYRQNRSTFESAKDRAIKDSNLRDPSHPRHRHPPTHDDIVAHITFATWVRLLPSKREPNGQIGPGAQRGLWNNAIKHAFPHKPDPLVIYHWANRLYLLRNRVAHVEPLIATDIVSYHRTAARLLRAIEPGLGDWYSSISRIPDVLKRRSALAPETIQ